jgi:O-antigen/teichoic acid export membrane protein
MIIRLTRTDQPGRSSLVGGLLRDQSRYVPLVAVLTVVLALLLWLTGHMNTGLAIILFGGTAAVMAALRREFYRMVLFAYRCPNEVLRSDLIYCGLLVAGAYAATFTPIPAAAAALTLALAALAGGSFAAHALWHHEPWNRKAPRGMLREIAPHGVWSSFGAGVHWLFSQGYNYLVAGTLDVTAVAALAATRLLVMPVGLLSTGIGTLLLPTVSRWVNQHSATVVLKRLALFAAGLAAAAGFYLLVMWLARDWIFSHILKKNFAHRDMLLGVWLAIALVTVFRDQLIYFLVTRAQFRLTAMITLTSAIFSFAVSLYAMHRIGAVGALIGLLAGEMLNVAGIIFYSLRHAAHPSDAVTAE